MTHEKHLPKIMSQWEFDYALFTNLPRIIVARNFSQSSFKLKEISYLSWQNIYPNLKTTCHIKLKIFLWTKLLENLLIAKYLISVTVPLKFKGYSKVNSLCNHCYVPVHQNKFFKLNFSNDFLFSYHLALLGLSTPYYYFVKSVSVLFWSELLFWLCY